MRVYSPSEANEIARHIQALHAYTAEAWAAVLDANARALHPKERRRRREVFESQVAEFEEAWPNVP